jgi:flagellar biosynthesis chaperone FliJ
MFNYYINEKKSNELKENEKKKEKKKLDEIKRKSTFQLI